MPTLNLTSQQRAAMAMAIDFHAQQLAEIDREMDEARKRRQAFERLMIALVCRSRKKKRRVVERNEGGWAASLTLGGSQGCALAISLLKSYTYYMKHSDGGSQGCALAISLLKSYTYYTKHSDTPSHSIL